MLSSFSDEMFAYLKDTGGPSYVTMNAPCIGGWTSHREK